MGAITKSNLVNTEDIINSNINDFVKASTETYSKYLETAPIFVTYFSKHQFSLNYDTGFESVNQFVGNESPVKFVKVDKLPVYGIDTADFSTDIMDGGVGGNFSSTGIILPDTVRPLPDDYLLISIHSKIRLFVVTTADPDNINQKKFYKFSFKLSPVPLADIEKQVVNELVMDYDQIGKSSNVLIQKDYYSALQDIRHIFDELLKRYSVDFYDSNKSIYRDPTSNVTDQYLNKFITDNRLHISFETYRNSRRVSETMKRYVKHSIYDKTIFKAVELHSLYGIDNTTSASVLIYLPETVRFGFNYYWKDKTSLLEHSLTRPAEMASFAIFKELNLDVFSNLFDPTKVTDPNLKFFRCYLEFINIKTTTSDDSVIRLKLDELIDLLGTIEGRNEYLSEDINAIYPNDYYLTPLILFSLLDTFNYITKAQTKT